MKTKLHSSLFSIFLLLLTNTVSAQFTVDGLEYTIISGTNVSVAKGSNPCPTGALDIPSTVTNATIEYTVTSIGNNAFYFCIALNSVTIPNSVTSIGINAFRACTALTSVSIGNSVTSIGASSFYGSNALTSVIIGNSVTSIGGSAFYDCTELTSVTIPNSVTSIGNTAFAYCGLTAITIPSSVTSIGDNAFRNCTGLTSVTIPNSVTSIGATAFRSCTGLTAVNVSWATPLSIISDVFINITLSGVTLNVSSPGVLTDYQTANVWKDFGTIVLSATSFQQNNNIKLYPNPANESIAFSGLLAKEKYAIYNLLGAKLSTGTVDNDQKIDTQNLTNGIYFIQLENGNSIKFIKE